MLCSSFTLFTPSPYSFISPTDLAHIINFNDFNTCVAVNAKFKYKEAREMKDTSMGNNLTKQRRRRIRVRGFYETLSWRHRFNGDE